MPLVTEAIIATALIQEPPWWSLNNWSMNSQKWGISLPKICN